MAKHIVSPKIYLLIFGSLLLMTGLTVLVAFQDLGGLNVFVAITIAVVKALLVALYFMHLRYTEYLTRLFFGAGVLWLAVLIGITLSDYLTRHLFTVRGW